MKSYHSTMVENAAIASDPPVHDSYRKPLVEQLSPAALAEIGPRVRALLDAAYAHFDGSAPDRPLLDEVWCGMYPDNHGSAGVAVRLGLEDLGILKDPWYEGDSHLFRTTREHWTAARRDRPVR